MRIIDKINQFGGLDKIPRLCTYCDYRHGGCSSDPIKAYDDWDNGNGGCKEFKLGSCFSCSIGLACESYEDLEKICPPYTDYEGCENYKE